ncbi:uncharacterized protein LOC143279828 [Babylonia areolata]|uniref:uncharacterized protein LOC143279828 n=1 Tax=Babylonia areolata TaxID=304850 RepID=UPI003FCFB298
MGVRLCRMRMKRVMLFLVLLFVITTAYMYYTLFIDPDHDGSRRHDHFAQEMHVDKPQPDLQPSPEVKHDSKVAELFPQAIQNLWNRRKQTTEESDRPAHDEDAVSERIHNDHANDDDALNDKIRKKLGFKLFPQGIQNLFNKQKETAEEPNRPPQDEDALNDKIRKGLMEKLMKQQKIIEKQEELLLLQNQGLDGARHQAVMPVKPPDQPEPDRDHAQFLEAAWRRQQPLIKDVEVNDNLDSNSLKGNIGVPLAVNGIQPRRKNTGVKQRDPAVQAEGEDAEQAFERARQRGREWEDSRAPRPGNVRQAGLRVDFADAGRMFHDSVRNNLQGRPPPEAANRQHLFQEPVGHNHEAPPRGGDMGAQGLFHDSVRNNPHNQDRWSNNGPFGQPGRNPILQIRDRNDVQRPGFNLDHNVRHRNIAAWGYPQDGTGQGEEGREAGVGQEAGGALPPVFIGNKGKPIVPYDADDEYVQDEKARSELKKEDREFYGNGFNQGQRGRDQSGLRGDEINAQNSRLLAERFRQVQNPQRGIKAPENDDRSSWQQNKLELKEALDFYQKIGGGDAFRVQVKDLLEPVTESVKCVLLKMDWLSRQVCVYPQHVDTKSSKQMILTGTFHEAAELKEFEAALSTNSSLAAVDIGAGLGVYSLLAGSKNRTVLAVEPMIDHQRLFTKTMQINGLTKQVTLVTNALGEQKGLGRVRSPHPSGDMGAVYVDPISDMSQAGSDVSSLVRILRLDDLLPVVTFSRAVMKLDAQGDEELVLRGAHRFFQKVDVRFVLMHWLPTFNRDHLQECQKFLTDNGYVPTDSVNGQRIYTEKDLNGDINFVVWRKAY